MHIRGGGGSGVFVVCVLGLFGVGGGFRGGGGSERGGGGGVEAPEGEGKLICKHHSFKSNIEEVEINSQFSKFSMDDRCTCSFWLWFFKTFVI